MAGINNVDLLDLIAIHMQGLSKKFEMPLPQAGKQDLKSLNDTLINSGNRLINALLRSPPAADVDIENAYKGLQQSLVNIDVKIKDIDNDAKTKEESLQLIASDDYQISASNVRVLQGLLNGEPAAVGYSCKEVPQADLLSDVSDKELKNIQQHVKMPTPKHNTPFTFVYGLAKNILHTALHAGIKGTPEQKMLESAATNLITAAAATGLAATPAAPFAGILAPIIAKVLTYIGSMLISKVATELDSKMFHTPKPESEKPKPETPRPSTKPGIHDWLDQDLSTRAAKKDLDKSVVDSILHELLPNGSKPSTSDYQNFDKAFCVACARYKDNVETFKEKGLSDSQSNIAMKTLDLLEKAKPNGIAATLQEKSDIVTAVLGSRATKPEEVFATMLQNTQQESLKQQNSTNTGPPASILRADSFAGLLAELDKKKESATNTSNVAPEKSSASSRPSPMPG